MITDPETNLVYLSGLLASEPKYRLFWNHLKNILEWENISFELLPNTRDLWCRDYMPLQVEKDQFVQFNFSPTYYKNPKYAHLHSEPKEVTKAISFLNLEHSTITLDGGNLVKWKDSAIMTEAVLKENTHIPKEELLSQLKAILQLELLWLIPTQPLDSSGHADGMVRFLDSSRLLVANYEKEKGYWKNKYRKALKETGLELIPFPAVNLDEKNEYGDYVATGCYINFAWIGNTIIFPQFGLDEDAEALELIRQLMPENKVVPVDCASLAYYGGVLNCCTWNASL